MEFPFFVLRVILTLACCHIDILGGYVPIAETGSTSPLLREELRDAADSGDRLVSDPRTPAVHSRV